MATVMQIAVGSTKNYTENWAPDLGTDTISGSPAWSFNLPGPVISGQSNTSNTTTAVIEAPLGAVAVGRFYELTCLIETASGLTLSKTFIVEVVANEFI